MTLIAEIVVSVFLVLGGGFALVGSFGLAKLDNPMSRLHAPTKASTLGVGGILAASMIFAFGVLGDGSLHELLIMGFLFVTTPVSAHFIAKANIHNRRQIENLPEPGHHQVWATLDTFETMQDETEQTASKSDGPVRPADQS